MATGFGTNIATMHQAAHRDEGVLLGNVRSGPLQPGRGTLVSRRSGDQLMQIAWLAPADPDISADIPAMPV